VVKNFTGHVERRCAMERWEHLSHQKLRRFGSRVPQAQPRYLGFGRSSFLPALLHCQVRYFFGFNC
jgi:hypothetical protein